MDAKSDVNDIQSRVLQTTLAEVSSSRSRDDTDNQNESCCVICLDNITEACEAKPCGHRNFDYLCLRSWLEQQTRCPLCKSNVEEVLYGFESDKPDAQSRLYLVPHGEKPSQGRVLSQVRPHPRPSSNFIPRPSRRRFEAELPQRVTVDEVVLRRQHVYRNHLYSLHVGSSHRSGYRDLTPELFDSDSELVSRARAWLRRELQVFEFLRNPPTAQSSDDRMTRRRANNAEFLLEYIIAILKTVDIQGSQGQAEEMLKDFLGRDNTKLLLHELKNYLRSPWSLEAWDRKVQYPTAKKRPVDEDGEREAYQGAMTRQGFGDPPFHRRKRLIGDSYRPTYSSLSRSQDRGVGQLNPDRTF
ncbi:hypothetical protein GGR53DRAFT_524447 [Hypoxylon sp. FL1150]|nr:hypothetical protein GGR53DRAFT_524447 [Hypoxylon sp. FL1150]